MSWICPCGTQNGQDSMPCASCGRVLFMPQQRSLQAALPKRRLRWVFLYVLGAAIVLVGMLSRSGGRPDADVGGGAAAVPNATSVSAPTRPASQDGDYFQDRPRDDPPTYAMEQEFSVGYWSYRVNSGSWMQAIMVSGGGVEMPDSAFLVLDISAKNDDRSASVLPQFRLFDREKREYELSSKGRFMQHPFGMIKAFEPLAEVNPGVPKRGYAVFDVPVDRQYMLLVSGGYHSRESAYVLLNQRKQITPTPDKEPDASLKQEGSSAPPPLSTSNPVLLHKVEPEYSEEARRKNFNGDVRTSIVINARGDVESVNVIDSPGLGLDEKITAAVRQWRFQPAMKDGVPTSVTATTTLTFKRD